MSAKLATQLQKKQIQSNTIFYEPVLELLNDCFPSFEVAVFNSLEGHDLEVVHVDVERVRFGSCNSTVESRALYVRLQHIWVGNCELFYTCSNCTPSGYEQHILIGHLDVLSQASSV